MKKLATYALGLMLLSGCGGGGESVQVVTRFSHLPDSVYDALRDSLNNVNRALFMQDNIVHFLSSGYMTVRDGYYMHIANYYGNRIPGVIFNSIEPIYKVGDGGHPNVVYSTDAFLCDGKVGFVKDGKFTLSNIGEQRPEGYNDGNYYNCTLDGNILSAAYDEVNSLLALFNRQGECLIPWSVNIIELVAGVYGVENDGVMTLVASDGKSLDGKQWKRLDKFPDNLVWAQQADGKVGLLDTKGATVVPFEYSFLTAGDKIHYAEKDGKTGYIDASRTFHEVSGYDQLGAFKGHYAGVVKDGKRGFINDKFELVLPCEYGQGNWRTESHFHVKEGDVHKVYDFTGKVVREFYNDYGEYSSFIKGGCIIPVFRNNKNGYEEIVYQSGDGRYIPGVFDYIYKDKFYGDTIYLSTVTRTIDGKEVTGMHWSEGDYDMPEYTDKIRYIPEFDAMLMTHKNHNMIQLRKFSQTDFERYIRELENMEKAKLRYGKDYNKLSVQIMEYLNNRYKDMYSNISIDDFTFKAEKLGVYTFEANAIDKYNGYGCTLDVTVYDNGSEFTKDLVFRKSYGGQKYKEDEKAGKLNLRPKYTSSENEYPAVEFGVEQDVWAYLYSNSFVSDTGTTLNFVKGCMYMNGQKVSGVLRVTLRDGDYTTAMLEGNGVWMMINGALNEIQNKADFRIYKRK